MAGTTEQLAKAVSRLSYQDIPALIVHQTKQVLVDCIGCSIAGHIVDRGRIALELVAELGGTPSNTILGQGRTSCVQAAYANGELMNALDYDPNGPSSGHVMPYVLPATLAMAERARISGKELLAAAAIAIEVGGRMATSVPGHRLPAVVDEATGVVTQEVNPRFGYTITLFGGIAGACRAMALDSARIVHALGIGGTNIPSATNHKWQYTGGPAAMSKYGSSSGLVSQLVATSVLLAEKGFTADDAILDGEWSLGKIFGVAYYKPERIVDGLGESWHFDSITLKAFPSCGADHAFVQGINRILTENGIDPDEVEGILAMGDPFYITPNRSQTSVQSYADTQFSHAYLLAVGAYHGRVPGPAWQLPETYRDPRIVALMKRARVEPHPQPTELRSGATAAGGWAHPHDAIVEVEARGRRYRAEVSAVKGSAADPLSDEEIRAKFMANAAYSRLDSGRAREALDMLYRLEEVDDISGLMGLLRV